jgi:hypothetical protein
VLIVPAKNEFFFLERSTWVPKYPDFHADFRPEGKNLKKDRNAVFSKKQVPRENSLFLDT